MTTFLIGLVLFLGVHSIRMVFPAAREIAISKIGIGPWKLLYSVLAATGLIMMVMSWPQARMLGITLWTSPPAMKHVTMLLMLPVFPLLLATYLPGKIQFTVKHPMLTATKLWAFSHLLNNGQLHEVLLFGGLLVWAVLVRISMKRRPQNTTAPASAGWSMQDSIAIVFGLALYVFFVTIAHGWLFGIALMPSRA